MITLRPLTTYLALLVLVGGGGLYGKSQYRAGQADMKAAYTLAELEQFKRISNELTGLSQLLEGVATALASAKPKTIERYTRVEVQSPLSAGCVRDPKRVRITNEGISEANASRQSISPVPSSTAR